MNTLPAPTLIKSLNPDAIIELVALDLIEAYQFAEDWESRDAIRKVVKMYTTTTQYEEFKEKYVES
jgi:hypothetical protein